MMLALLMTFGNAYSQIDTSGLWVDLDSMTITATKVNKIWIDNVKSVTEISLKEQKQSLQQKSLQEYLVNVPGLFTFNANNFAQDLRISIRGFGARSAFGIRGLKLIVDNIPETTPDGQGQIDAIPLSLIQNIEVIRGPSSLLYGNAAGGVLSINTLSEFNHNLLSKPLIKARLGYGSFNSNQIDLTYAQKVGKTSFVINGNQTRSDGYRSLSGFINRSVKGRFDHRFSKFSKVNAMFDYVSSPKAEDSGALTLLEIDSSRQQARPRNQSFKTGEIVKQMKASLAYTLLASDQNTLDIYGFFTQRKFEGYLPFEIGGIVNLNRKYLGQGASYTLTSKKNFGDIFIKYGYDISRQIDDRKRFSNLMGASGPLDLDQLEEFNTLGLYTLGDIDFDSFILSAGFRFDHNAIKIEDNYFFDDLIVGSGTGNRSYKAFNHSLGLNYNIDSGNHLFLSYSTSFETPSLTELTANPETLSGLNNSLEPQRAINFEAGIKSNASEGLRGQIALFHISTKDEIVRYMLDSLPNRVFYRNAGSTKRTGLEVEGFYDGHDAFSGSISYTFSRFKFLDYVTDSIDNSGKTLPGIPQHHLAVKLNYQHDSGIKIGLQNRIISSIYLNDINAIKDDGYFISNLSLSYQLDTEAGSFVPFFGINNLTNTKYHDNLRVNASFGRYYEPAPGINFYGGVKYTY